MKKECKICLPVYKLVYSVCFIVILSMVRGISGETEIGVTMQVGIGLLALVFCADTYECEYMGKRWEVFSLRPRRNQVKAVCTRLLVEMGCLFILSIVGYGLFYWQRPRVGENLSSLELFLQYLPGAAASVLFWGTVTVVLSGILHNMMAGIAGSLVLWLTLNSTVGEALLGKWNVFAYTFRNTSNPADFSWLCGTILAVILSAAMIAAIPWVIKIRRSHSRRS